MNRPPIKKECPECGGSGEIWDKHIHDPNYDNRCYACIKGKVYNYLTPEQWESETGEKMLDSDPVWIKSFESETWVLVEYCNHEAYYDNENRIIVARPGQPKPVDGWRPDE